MLFLPCFKAHGHKLLSRDTKHALTDDHAAHNVVPEKEYTMRILNIGLHLCSKFSRCIM